MARYNARTVGANAEHAAGRFLVRNGLRIITRNFRCRLGEIDLVLLDRDCLVFAEVRFRGGRKISSAGSTVDVHKQRKLVRTAAMFLQWRPQFADYTMRFDVVAIEADDRFGESIEWIRDAFRPGDSSL